MEYLDKAIEAAGAIVPHAVDYVFYKSLAGSSLAAIALLFGVLFFIAAQSRRRRPGWVKGWVDEDASVIVPVCGQYVAAAVLIIIGMVEMRINITGVLEPTGKLIFKVISRL